MTWTSDLQKIDVLSTELGLETPITSLNYHLHQSWTLDEDYAVGREACGAANLGGHYDPFFAVSSILQQQQSFVTILLLTLSF